MNKYVWLTIISLRMLLLLLFSVLLHKEMVVGHSRVKFGQPGEQLEVGGKEGEGLALQKLLAHGPAHACSITLSSVERKTTMYWFRFIFFGLYWF